MKDYAAIAGSVIPTLTAAETAAFWAKSSPQPNGCREWHGTFNHARTNPHRVGLFTFYRDGKKFRFLASRVALALTTGKSGVYACHHCDNPPCVLPEHLYWGDPLTNSQDMYERNAASKLGRPRPDVTLRLVAATRERGGEATTVTSDELSSWSLDQELDAIGDVDRFIDRFMHGDRLPEVLA